MNRPDPLERAFELLREAHGAALPDPRLEARLVASARERSMRRRAPRSRRLVLAGAFALCGGAAFAAAGGWRWIRSWIVRVEFGDARLREEVEGEGARTYRWKTPEGEAQVRVERTREGSATRTRIAIDRIEGERVDAERAEDVRGGRARALEPLAVLGGAEPFYVGSDPAGGRIELYALDDGAGGSRLYVARTKRHRQAVEELAHLPFELLARGARAEIEERADGALALSFTDGRGAELAFVLESERAELPARSSLETEDGAIRVEVEEEP